MSQNSDIMIEAYIRLLSYENALKVIDFIHENDKNDIAYITPGGTGLKVKQDNFEKVVSFIESLNVRYEISEEHPSKVNQRIINNLKNQ